MRLLECVPNFSEGRDQNIIQQIVSAIKEQGVTVLDVDPGAATNRTVVTFAGEPDMVVEAAFAGIKKASELIDMKKHKGAHPRMGATDVCPFIPLEGVSEEEAVFYAEKLAKKVGEELLIPVYLYEKSAKTEKRKNLANIREGEYEGFFDKIKKDEWRPDYGPSEFSSKSGGTVIGVREFLIAYNINLNTRSVPIAKKIADQLREKGVLQRDEQGKLLKDENGEKIFKPGLFKDVKAVGWYIPEYQRAQISINLVNYKVSPLHEVFDAACKLAEIEGIRVTGSELVGLIPKEPLFNAGVHYLKKSNQSYAVSEIDAITTAIQSLGLSELTAFNPTEKVIEYKTAVKRPLISKTVVDFCDELASDSPAPGGGSIAALAGALSSALSSMVGNLTIGKKGYESFSEEFKELSYKAQRAKEFFTYIIDEDTFAFDKIMDAFKLPKKTDEEKTERDNAIEEATKNATKIPFSVLERVPEILEYTLFCIKNGNQNALSDSGVSGLMAKSAAYGAFYNVKINIKSLKDETFKNDILEKSTQIIKKVDSLASEIESIINERL
ncbi:glutamate formimidoyltransferase [bacterium]|nr:glutamate formimidoyltransferase [bacterium]